MVTHVAANLLRLADRGSLRVGLRADLLVLPRGATLGEADRRDVRLVMINGVARYGDAECPLRASPHADWTRIQVDGAPKVIAGSIARSLELTRANEPDLQFVEAAGRAA
jgi:hypothetical protein